MLDSLSLDCDASPLRAIRTPVGQAFRNAAFTLAACALACDLEEPTEPVFRSSEGEVTDTGADVLLVGDAAPLVKHANGDVETPELVFASFVELSEAGDVVDYGSVGDLTVDQRDRVARPWLYGTEEELYVEEAWEKLDGAGNQLRGYRVWRHKNAASAIEVGSGSGPPTVNPNVIDHIASAPADELLHVDLRLADYPPWDVPLRADPNVLAASDVLARQEAREVAMLQRADLFADRAGGVESHVAALGGRVLARFPNRVGSVSRSGRKHSKSSGLAPISTGSMVSTARPPHLRGIWAMVGERST